MSATIPRWQDIPLLKEYTRLVTRQKELDYLSIKGPLNDETSEFAKAVQDLSNEIFKLTADLAVCKEMYSDSSAEFLNMEQPAHSNKDPSDPHIMLLLAKNKNEKAELELNSLRQEIGVSNNTLNSLRQQNMILEYKLKKEKEDDHRVIEESAAGLKRMQEIISDIPLIAKAEKKKTDVEDLNNRLAHLSVEEVDLKTSCASIRSEIEQSSKVPVTTFVRNLARICAQRSSTLNRMSETEHELQEAKEKLEERNGGEKDVFNVTMLEDMNCTMMVQSQLSPSSQGTADVGSQKNTDKTEEQPMDTTAMQSEGNNSQTNSEERNDTVDVDHSQSDVSHSQNHSTAVAAVPMETDQGEVLDETTTNCQESEQNVTVCEEAISEDVEEDEPEQEDLNVSVVSQPASENDDMEQEPNDELSESFHTGLTQVEGGSAFQCLDGPTQENSQMADADISSFDASGFQASQETSPFDMFSSNVGNDDAEAILNISQNSEDAGADFLAFMSNDKPTGSATAPDFSFSKEFGSAADGDASGSGFDFNFGGSSPSGGTDFNFDFGGSGDGGNAEETSFNFNF